ADDAACRLRGEPAEAQAHRGDLRLAEDGGDVAQNQTQGSAESRMGVHLRGRRLQPGADPKPGPGDWPSGRLRSSVSGLPEKGSQTQRARRIGAKKGEHRSQIESTKI